MSLFEQAKAQEATATPTKTKSNKRVVRCDLRIKPFEDMQKQVKQMETDMKMIKADLVEEGVDAIFDTNNAESFILEGQDGGRVMIVPIDKYKLPDEAFCQAHPELIEEQTEFSFDAEILAKYGEEISQAIMNAPIPETARLNLIKAKSKKTVKKGLKDNLANVNRNLVEPLLILQVKNA